MRVKQIGLILNLSKDEATDSMHYSRLNGLSLRR